jgi:Phage stabilisation protein
MDFPFLGPAYPSRSANYSSQRLVNMYLEAGKGKSPWVLIGTPGLTAPVVTLSGGGIRGAIRVNESVSVWVCGENVYRVNDDFTTSVIGTIPNDGEPVTMAFNGSNVAITSAGNLYGVTTSGTSASLIRANTSSVDFLDGYFVLTDQGTGQFYVSGQYTTTIDALDFATAEGAPDNLVRVLVNNREAILFGVETTEVWYNAGSVDFPLARVQGAFIQEGLAAKNSAVRCGDTVAWLGANQDGDSNVWTMQGYQPRQISTQAIAYAISQWADKSDAWAFFYKQEGHAFYVLSSPSANETWAYDFSTGEWHQRAYLNDSGVLERIRVNTHVHFSGRSLVGDWETGEIYEYDLDTYSDNGDPIQRVRTCSTNQNDLVRMRNRSFRLDMDTGVGLSTGQGSDPQAMLRFSKDGGKTWSNQLWRSLGLIGEYNRRARWMRVGGGEREVYELIITDPVKVCITGATLS